MWNILSLLQKNLVWSIPVAMLAGLLCGISFNTGVLKQAIIPVTFIMVYPMMVTLNVKSIFQGHDYKIQITTQVINFLMVPLLAYFVGAVFFSGTAEKFGLWAVGLFLIGVMPTSGMTISWTGFAGGNKEAAIKMVIFGLFLGAVAAPVYTKIFMGTTVDVNITHMFRQIALFVFIPMGAGLLTQYFGRRRYGSQTWDDHLKPKFPPFSALGVILIAFVAMSLKAKNIVAAPQDILLILFPLIVFYVLSYGVLSLLGRLFFTRENAIAMVFGVVMRNLSIALAIAMTAFGQEGLTIALLISLAYVIQIQSAAWYIKLTDKIFGPAAPLAASPAPLAESAEPPLTTGEPAVAGIKKILFATDLSETARHAVRYACSLGYHYQAQVTIIHVVPDILEEYTARAGINLYARVKSGQWEQLNQKEIAAATATIRSRIRATSARVLEEIPHCPLAAENILIKVGRPAEAIARAAEEGDFDLIIMGTHGHGKMTDMIIGSIADGVIRQTPKPVLVVKNPG